MKKATFLGHLDQPGPPAEVSPALRVLWYAYHDNWERAHDIAQDMPGPPGAWLHAYLHRWEGDTFNAGYWYRRANRPVPDYSLVKEWNELVEYFTDSEDN